MTQQEQQDFKDLLKATRVWIQEVQEKLNANDNTHGPREALETRLRETKKIHESEHEGLIKIDLVLVAAKNLLQSEDEELKKNTNIELKELKSLWDDTSTHIIHCHSRIEWVWLHWSEYLKAYSEFQQWLLKQHLRLEVGPELQLDLKEKLWQVDQQQVVLSDVHSQVALLERLLDEAAALHSRTQDPSVDPQAQQRLQEDYNDVRDRTEERLALLQKISEEHQMFHSQVQSFQVWLLSRTKELTELMGRDDTIQNKLQALQALDNSVAGEEEILQKVEGVADSVRNNSSPAGAEAVQREVEDLKLGWQRLRQGLNEARDGLRCRLDSQDQYLTRCRRLGDDIGSLRELLKGLDLELEETHESRSLPETTEEEMVGCWKKYSGVRNTLAQEDSQVDLLKFQLKELFRFSEDSRQLSDDVLAVVKDHQSVKSRANRLCSESELELRSLLQDPLVAFSQWSRAVAQVMEASSQVTDFSNTARLRKNIQGLLKDSIQLKERLGLLQVKGDLLDSVFGSERSDGLREDLSLAIRTRELLHSQLLQRDNRLQALISRTKDFDETLQMIGSKLQELRERLKATDVHQPDILTKKSQLDQLLVLQKDLQDGEAQLTALETLVSDSPDARTRYEKLSSDWTELQRRVGVQVQEAQETLSDHQSFHGDVLNMQKWMMVMRQKLESFCSSSGGWSVDGRQPEAQRALAEFPEKELQLHQIEIQAQKVLSRTSSDGQVHILADLDHLRESWRSLSDLSQNLHRLQDFTEQDGPREPSKDKKMTQFQAWLSKENQVLLRVIRTGQGELSAEEVRTRQETLQSLRSRLSEGQQMFQALLTGSQCEDEVLEDLRYRWMLYKSKLKEESNRSSLKRVVANQEASAKTKVQKSPGLLQRICRLALLLWLLLLALLLLAFLLPLMDDGHSCSLSNNFARSFSIMLRYDGPPPT